MRRAVAAGQAQAVGQPGLGGVDAQHPQPHTVGDLLSLPVDVLQARPGGDDRLAPLARALGGDAAAVRTLGRVVVHVLGVVAARVDAVGADTEQAATGVCVGCADQVVELAPDAGRRLHRLSRRARQHLVVHRPVLKPWAPGLHCHLQPVVLGVREGGQHQRLVGHDARRQRLGLGTLVQLVDGADLVAVVVAQRQARVHEGAQLRAVARLLGGIGRAAQAHQVQPAGPAQGGVELADVEGLGAVVAGGAGGPLASGQQGGLVVLVDLVAALRADHPGPRARLVAAHVAPDQLVHVTAVWARHEVVLAVAAQVELMYFRDFGRLLGAARQVDLCVAPEGASAVFQHLDRVALALDVGLPVVDLVAREVAGRDLGQVGRRAGGGHVERAAPERLRGVGVLAISGARLGEQVAHGRRGPDGVVDPQGQPLGQEAVRHQRQDVGRRLVGHAHDEVHHRLGLEQLRGAHHHDPPRRAGWAEGAQHAGREWGTGQVVLATLGIALGGDVGVIARPGIKPEFRVRLEAGGSAGAHRQRRITEGHRQPPAARRAWPRPADARSPRRR